MAAIEIPEELASQIEHGAQLAGQSSGDFLHKAVLTYLEDMEDLALATERLKDIGERTSLEDLRKELGLAD